MLKTYLIRTDVFKLRKQQLLTYVNQTVEVVEAHNPEALHMAVMLGKLSALKPELKKLEVSYNDALAETAHLQLINSDINNALRAILLQTGALKRMQNVQDVDKVALILPFTKRYVRASIPENLETTVNICNRMFSELQSSVDLQEAITSVGLKTYFDEVKRLLERAEVVSSERLKQHTQRGRSETAVIRNKVSKAVSNLLNAIEVAAVEHSELDYEPLKSALNVLNTTYRATLKARETRSKTAFGAKSETTVASSSKTTATVA